MKTSGVLREKWDLVTAVLVERKPVISPALNDLEKAFQDYMSEVEFEKSLRNDVEIKIEKEKYISVCLTVIWVNFLFNLFFRSVKLSELENLDLKSTQTVQDFIDLYKEELSKFKPAEKVTSILYHLIL